MKLQKIKRQSEGGKAITRRDRVEKSEKRRETEADGGTGERSKGNGIVKGEEEPHGIFFGELHQVLYLILEQFCEGNRKSVNELM